MTHSAKFKILILGAQGMLGTDLAHVLVGPAQLFLWDKDELDVTRERLVNEKIVNLAPAIIINATGYTDVDGAEDNREMAFKVNAEAVNYLVLAAAEVKAKFVHFSTEYVFDGLKQAGYDESAEPNPLNMYGQSKAAGEKFVTSYARGYLVRTSWLYGHTPQQGKPRGLNFIDTVLKLAAAQAEVRVVNDQYGQPTATQDLALAVDKLVLGDYAPGIYHLVNEGVTTWYEVTREVFKIKGITTPLVPISSSGYPTKAKRPQYGVLLNTKLPKLRPWPRALSDYLTL
ncbi:MAG: dTDP-4-dehydrorhamnose reductase [Candidatus Kerfeldbacteria bacterium]|nr:dTDP-4-dehydrorhamnose reductase [Candidatus Kerfeldbacteria bacterium]